MANAMAKPDGDTLVDGAREVLRATLFRETWNTWAQRWVLGTAYALMPVRIRSYPSLVWHTLSDLARGGTPVPDQARTHPIPDTFAGVCRRISPETILAAARLGFYPWCHCGPLKWWTSQWRMVLFFNEHHIPKRLRRDMKKAPYRVTFDQAFEQVIAACAGQRSYNKHALTWITPRIMRLYAGLFDQGHAHSFEVWDADGKLVGGGYGLSVGRVFITESQFSLAPNTSKMGFAVLNYHLAKWGYVLNDGKNFTPTIEAMGFRLIPRCDHEAILRDSTQIGAMGGKVGRWNVDADLATVAAWEPKPETAAAA
ncbi:MAG: leucyl/phenylalanyl-tRNA--protein transferase [Hyphomicrobium sp.]|uniref:leucyl/phenylalanyl-tRNA--protein transferase n=1 Tax=Hyphomicrobium sp. TaxID=82 RepID=UPI003D0F3069